ncbi:F0F1 ATP synthase subunit delta [Desulfurivibrio alkaliphilus]|uniref:ATP synthase subunit delta n=1 Tax=Desulfurivibrio alkaliphilus (strain DSM 19089 / UNIQEM U267 / AHT2) TaxID=589865 RepID=D6Z4V4_DESAT|nr:F0F1 ATP synthase subunit delta [Desulfurivibrio alkaliphilus]ADH86579.1 ATP synthase F1, delta subunit [Desulfurivibrio alkaliphilus AHT 2]
MKNTVLAKRYAKALFAVGKEDGAFADYAKLLNELTELYTGMPEVPDALTNPLYPEDVRLKVMESLAAALKAPPVMVNFCKLLVEKKRAAILPEIAQVYQEMLDEENNVVRGVVTSATELSPEVNAKIKATMEKLTGKQVELSNRIDPAIIGGMVAKVGDLVLDGSIKSQLAGLKESIKGRE